MIYLKNVATLYLSFIVIQWLQKIGASWAQLSSLQCSPSQWDFIGTKGIAGSHVVRIIVHLSPLVYCWLLAISHLSSDEGARHTKPMTCMVFVSLQLPSILGLLLLLPLNLSPLSPSFDACCCFWYHTTVVDVCVGLAFDLMAVIGLAFRPLCDVDTAGITVMDESVDASTVVVVVVGIVAAISADCCCCCWPWSEIEMNPSWKNGPNWMKRWQ